MRFALYLLGLAGIAYGQECDCAAFTACKKAERKVREAEHEEIKQCFESCKTNLDVALRNAMDSCKPPEPDHAKFECMMEKTCISRSYADGPMGFGRHHGGMRGGPPGMMGPHHGGMGGPPPPPGDGNGPPPSPGGFGGKMRHMGGGGKGPLGRLEMFLSDAQKASLEEYGNCVMTNCFTKGMPEPPEDSCRSEHPNCGHDHSKIELAAEECGLQRPEEGGKSKGCECITEQLGITDNTACARFGPRGGPPFRRQRSVAVHRLAEMF